MCHAHPYKCIIYVPINDSHVQPEKILRISRAYLLFLPGRRLWNKCSPCPLFLFDVTQNPCCVRERVRVCTDQRVEPHQTVCMPRVSTPTQLPYMYIFVSSPLRTKILLSAWNNKKLQVVFKLIKTYCHPCTYNNPLQQPRQDGATLTTSSENLL